MALVTGTAVIFVEVKNAVFPTIDGKDGLSVSLRYYHIYHTRNSNADGTTTGVLQSIFSTVVDTDAYTFSGILKQLDHNNRVEAILVKSSVHKKRNH